MILRGHRFARTAPLVTAALAVLAVAAAPPPPAAADSAKPTAMVLVLDASGSMNESDGHGSTKIAAARTAMKTIINELSPDLKVGLRVYGQKVASSQKAKACQDTQLASPVTPLDRAALTTAVGKVTAKGETPIGLSLQKAAADIPAGEVGSIILVSDGEDSCAPPEPCDVAKQLASSGVKLTVDTLGLKVNSAAKTQLSCIATATGGTFTDVKDTATLATKLGQVTQQATRAQRVATLGTGIAIQGAATRDAAPKLSAGTFTDTIQPKEVLYYAIDATVGQTVKARVIADATTSKVLCEGLSVQWQNADGNQPAGHPFANGNCFQGKQKIYAVTMELPPDDSRSESGTFYLEVDGTDVEDKQMPIKLEVTVTGAGASASPSAGTDPSASASDPASSGSASGSPAASASASPAAGASGGTDPTTPVADKTTSGGFSIVVLLAVGLVCLLVGLVSGALTTFVLGRKGRGRRSQGGQGGRAMPPPMPNGSPVGSYPNGSPVGSYPNGSPVGGYPDGSGGGQYAPTVPIGGGQQPAPGGPAQYGGPAQHGGPAHHGGPAQHGGQGDQGHPSAPPGYR